MKNTPRQNKSLVVEAFDTLFSKRDYEAAATSGRTPIFSTARTSNPDATACSI
jgi:hypothetical protein